MALLEDSIWENLRNPDPDNSIRSMHAQVCGYHTPGYVAERVDRLRGISSCPIIISYVIGNQLNQAGLDIVLIEDDRMIKCYALELVDIRIKLCSELATGFIAKSTRMRCIAS
jgi:hypothetical protein